MYRSRETTVLIACITLGLLVLAGLALNVARLGSAIAREVGRAQVAYVQTMGHGEPVETNAVLLGHCLRQEMLKSARSGVLHPDSWAVAARLHAAPRCTRMLPPIPPATPPVITSPRARPILASAPLVRWPLRTAVPADGR